MTPEEMKDKKARVWDLLDERDVLVARVQAVSKEITDLNQVIHSEIEAQKENANGGS